MSDNLLLTLLWSVPLAGACVVLLLPKGKDLTVKGFSLGTTLLTLFLAIYAFGRYAEPNAAAPLTSRVENNVVDYDKGEANDGVEVADNTHDGRHDLVVRQPWIPYFKIEYYLGLDGISLSLVLLTGLVSVLACLASWKIEKSVKGYFALFLVLLASMMGVFLALDLILFFVFFEVMLLPMYFLIGVWGGENREYAAIKFLLYTLFGSVFILVAVLALYYWPGESNPMGMNADFLKGKGFQGHSFDIVLLTRIATETGYYGVGIQRLVFALFFIGFCVKLPSFPFHTWLPDAHVQAPTPISMILAGVLLKIGGYGLVRLAWPLAPAGAYDLAMYAGVLGVFSIVYGALVAMAQTDFKKLVAYSSVSHMGYVTLGMAVMTLASNSDPRFYAYGVNGAMFMMIAHGITSTGMFFLVGVIYERAHTRDLNKLGGLLNTMPVYGAISFLIFFGSMGLPGLCGFIAEAFVVLATFNYSKILAVFAAAAVVLTAGYILWTLQRVFLGTWRGAGAEGAAHDEHGHAGHDDHAHAHGDQAPGVFPDLDFRELVIAGPLVALTIILGVFPQSLLGWMGPSVDQEVHAVASARILVGGEQPIAQAVASPETLLRGGPPPMQRAPGSGPATKGAPATKKAAGAAAKTKGAATKKAAGGGMTGPNVSPSGRPPGYPVPKELKPAAPAAKDAPATKK